MSSLPSPCSCSSNVLVLLGWIISEEERPRFFYSKAKSKCWASAETVPGRHPERWHKDAADNIVCKCFCNCQGCIYFE
ncbi:hypothetical protein ERO13_D01G195266v2 [Gossypium hirsutum]|nr:hypothetical protein ERO13_D01G195266v2 [Gossypium hirsutum]